jgi:diaminohydroxyphosphoribosylaminopyrimidine deaminase/5-amino-6-(5-phosphoribosylamino)uracil reductase
LTPSLPPEAEQLRFMAMALDEAQRGLGCTAPNPAVGVVVVRDGAVVGRGYHAAAGRPHAEVVALADAGEAARGADLYVNLEPCSHFGRTPPCAPAVVAAGVRRVFVGMVDPNPRVDGRGLAMLREAGVEVVTGVCEAECEALNAPFVKWIRRGVPWVTLKLATSLDGRIATRTGASQWITSVASRARVQALRAAVDAVMVGSRTVRADDPRLTVREGETPRARQPLRVVVDRALATPPEARLLRETGRALVATTVDAPAAAEAALVAAGAEVVRVAAAGDGAVDLVALLEGLAKRDVLHVLVEGGGGLAGALLDRDLVDEVVWFVAPVILGGAGAVPAVGGVGAATLQDAVRLAGVHVERAGPDLVVTGRPVRGDATGR